MMTLDTDQAPQGSAGAASDAALSSLVGLARLSRLTLLYHGPAGSDGGREQAAALARASSGDIAVVFDAGSDMPLPDLLSAIEEAVLEARPQAPLAPPMAGPVEALLSWQQALDLRFLLVFYRFDVALAHADAEFEAELLRLVRDPEIDLSLLLMMNEAAAPQLERLRAELPDLGENYLRLPGTAAPRDTAPASQAEQAAPMPAAPFTAQTPSAWFEDETMPDAPAQAMPPAPAWPQRQEPSFAAMGPAPFWPEPASEEDDSDPDASAQAEADEADEAAAARAQRRRRPFSSLLEQAVPGLSFDADETEAQAGANMPAATAPTAETPWIAPRQGTAYADREPRPLPVAAWMQKRQARRRRATLALASASGMSSGILFFFMLMLALICWALPQLH
jgi:hypothetical protein